MVVKRLKRVLLAWLSWKEVLKEVWWKMENGEVGKWWLRGKKFGNEGEIQRYFE